MIPAGSYALHTGYILKASGRWNRRGRYGCLYASLSPDGARAELEKYARRSGVDVDDLPAYDLVAIRVVATPVLDLGDPVSQESYGLTSTNLTSDSTTDYEACRAAADLARARGFIGILSPSAAFVGANNLNLYIDGPADAYDLSEGTERMRVNY